jgi:alpha-beta hydrolase superfamily lysophospholipase
MGCAEGARDTLERQLKQAGFKNVKAAVLDSCAHWLFEETPAETVSAIGDFIAGASN